MNLRFIKPIRTEEEYEAATERMAALAHSQPGTEERKEMDLLYDLVEFYEDKHHKVEAPLPHEAIKFRMEQSGRELDALSRLVGSKIRAQELLSGARVPGAGEVILLHEKWAVPLESLLSRGVAKTQSRRRGSAAVSSIAATISQQNKIRWAISHGMDMQQIAELLKVQPNVARALVRQTKQVQTRKG